MPSKLSLIAASLCLILSLAACDVVNGRQTAGEYWDDASISTRVKSDLMRTKTMNPLTQIHVETFKGHVTLSGQAASRKAADKALSIARAVPTVTGVTDAMTVRGEAAPAISTGAPQPITDTPDNSSSYNAPLNARHQGQEDYSAPPQPMPAVGVERRPL
jgi:hypothetical protein